MLDSKEVNRLCRRDCPNMEEGTKRKFAFTEPTKRVSQLCQPLKNRLLCQVRSHQPQRKDNNKDTFATRTCQKSSIWS